MKSFKGLFLFLALSLMFSLQVFAARGVDYNGQGNPVTISSDATGLTVGTGQSIYLADGSALVTGAGVLTNPGAVSCRSLSVGYGNITITAGNIVQAGNITQSSGNHILTSGGITAAAGTISSSILTATGYLNIGAVVAISGTATARATLRGLSAGDAAPIGTIYISSGGKLYQKVVDNNADADWRLVTVTDAD